MTTTYLILERIRPLCWQQVATIYGTVTLCIGSLVLLFTAMGTNKSPGPLYDLYRYTEGPIGATLLFLSALWPMVVGGVFRVIAKRRAGLRSWAPL